MSTQAAPLPHFSGKNELSLQDLDALSRAVRAQGMTAELVPAAAHRGCRRYTGANYNLAQFADACTGEVATPDKLGLIASVDYDAADAPYIDAGNMVLPLAHDLDPADDSSEPTALVAGGLYRVDAVEGLTRPQIKRGAMQLPLAQSSWPQTAEGAMYTPGLVYAVQYDDAEACEGAVLPRIEQGVIHLRAGGGGGGVDECPGGCCCAPAWYDACEGTCVLGLIRSVGYDDALSEPRIDDGNIKLPVGLRGVLADGVPKSWAELECMGYVRLHAGGADSLPVSVSVSNGYLNIYVDRP